MDERRAQGSSQESYRNWHGRTKARIHTSAALGMDGLPRYPDHSSRKSHWPWETASGGLAVRRGVFVQFAENADCWTKKFSGLDLQETEERIERYAKRLQRIQMESKDGVGKQKGFGLEKKQKSHMIWEPFIKS